MDRSATASVFLLWGFKVSRRKNKKTNPQPSKPSGARRKWILVGILVCAVCIFFFQGGVVGFSNSMANNAMLARNLDSAQGWLNFSQRLSGDNAEIEFLLAKKCRLDRDLVGMSKHLTTAYELGFDKSLLEKEQTLATVSTGEFDLASELKVKKWIAEKGPDIGDIVDAYANGLATLSRFQDAAQILEAYEKDYPGDPMVNYRFGIMNEHIRGTAQAEREYATVLAKDPKHVQAAWRLARLKSGNNAPEESIKILEKFDYGKQSLAIKTFLGHCYEQSGDLEKSRELFKAAVDKGHDACQESYKVVEEAPERFLAASDLGVLEVKLGNWEDAKKYLEMALEVNPRDFIARNSYGRVLQRLGMEEQAEKEFARIKEEREEFDKITILRDRVNQNPKDTASRVQMGKILFKYESERFGLFWIRAALSQDPNCQEAHQFLADYYESKTQGTDSGDNEINRRKAAYHRSFIKSSDPQPPAK